MEIVPFIISLISGAVGGNVGGAAVGKKSLGTAVNTIIGLLGGAGGDFILKALGVLATTMTTNAMSGGAATGHEFNLATFLANVGVSGVSGGVLTAVIALIKDAIQKK